MRCIFVPLTALPSLQASGRFPPVLLVVFHILQDISGLAVQRLTYRVQVDRSHRFCLVILQDRQICERDIHFPASSVRPFFLSPSSRQDLSRSTCLPPLLVPYMVRSFSSLYATARSKTWLSTLLNRPAIRKTRMMIMTAGVRYKHILPPSPARSESCRSPSGLSSSRSLPQTVVRQDRPEHAAELIQDQFCQNRRMRRTA